MKYQIIVNPSPDIQVIDIDVPFNYTVTKIPVTPTTTTTTSTTSTTTTSTTTKIPTGTQYLSLPTSGKIVAQSNQIIENLQFKNTPDVAIRVGNVSNVIIRNCFFNRTGAEAIEIEGAVNVTVTNCLFYDVTTGVYALSSKTIKANNNQAVNVRRRLSGHRGQFVQFNGVSGAGNEIIGNKIENFPGESDPEDAISLYASSGIQGSPITVRDNWIRGGGPKDLGPDSSGGGIMSGDTGGSWQLVENNKLLNPGNYIVAIAGGSNIIVRNNQGYQELKPWSNIGGYAYGGQQGAECRNVTFTGNNLWAQSPDHGLNHYYFGSGSEVCTGSTLSPNYSTITPAQLGFPEHLINFITPAELLKIRGK